MTDENKPQEGREPIQQLALTWLQREGEDEPKPYLDLLVHDEAKATPLRYAVIFSVCSAPRCDCSSVFLSCTPFLPDGRVSPSPVRSFWFDVSDRSILMSPSLQADSEVLRLAQIIQRGLREEDWERLGRWFKTAKIHEIETADVAQIELADLPYADDGRMVPFTEVFPRGLSLYFTYEGAIWAADEHYCVQPACNCNGLAFAFLMLKDAHRCKSTAIGNAPAIRYNYRSHAAEQIVAGPLGTPPTRKLLAALRSANPSLDTRVELHHTILRVLYARQYAERTQRQKEEIERQRAGSAPRVGRNDPCPCGSGKKFKKCCGRAGR